MDRPCILRTMQDQQLTQQFVCPGESFLSSSQETRKWPVSFHTQILEWDRWQDRDDKLRYAADYNTMQFLPIKILIQVVKQPWLLHFKLHVRKQQKCLQRQPILMTILKTPRVDNPAQPNKIYPRGMFGKKRCTSFWINFAGEKEHSKY